MVEDHGRGIPEDEIPRIFDTFYQINREHNEDQGAGAGLAIVRGIAEVHKAKITVDSVEDRGSIFTLHFPRVEL
jgi:two-component system phosphate regulon sensor histidine kinase PhoR